MGSLKALWLIRTICVTDVNGKGNVTGHSLWIKKLLAWSKLSHHVKEMFNPGVGHGTLGAFDRKELSCGATTRSPTTWTVNGKNSQQTHTKPARSVDPGLKSGNYSRKSEGFNTQTVWIVDRRSWTLFAAHCLGLYYQHVRKEISILDLDLVLNKNKRYWQMGFTDWCGLCK